MEETLSTKDSRWKLLVIDDDSLILQSLKIGMPSNWMVIGVSAPDQIPKQAQFSAAFIDLHYEPCESTEGSRPRGLEAIRKLHSISPELEIIAISGNLNRALMEECLTAGATRFLPKPLVLAEVHSTLAKIQSWLELRSDKSAVGADKSNSKWVGKGSCSLAILRQIAALKNERGPILIQGESGSGKEVAASLMRATDRNRPFISVNLAAIPETVFESEFFGHLRGSFTGAEKDRIGLAEAAHGGDLFLDEVEALPLTQQAKLLRFLENGEVRKVGSKESRSVDVRIIAATNQDLSRLVKQKQFRLDLWWRLSGKILNLPPLRDRIEDIPMLAEYFLALERPRVNKFLGEDALRVLQQHNYPGNVRELKRVCEQLLVEAPLPIVRAGDVHRVLERFHPPQQTHSNSDQHSEMQRLYPDPDEIMGAHGPGPGLAEILARFEAEIIRKALHRNSSNARDIDEVAKELKISRSSLYKKIKDYAIPLGNA